VCGLPHTFSKAAEVTEPENNREEEMTEKEKSLTVLVWEHCPSTYKGSALVVLLKIAGLSGRDGHAWPSMKRLARMCGIAKRSLQDITAKFEEQGILQIQERRGHSSRFFLNSAAIRKLPSVVPVKEETPAVTVTPEPTAPAAPPNKDGLHVAQQLAAKLREENPAVTVPNDLTDWAAKLQTLLDAGNTLNTVKMVCRFARKHEWWSGQFEKRDAVTVLTEHFALMLKQLQNQKVAA
jgi:hypothetical protein